jgi:hypothetical protein
MARAQKVAALAQREQFLKKRLQVSTRGVELAVTTIICSAQRMKTSVSAAAIPVLDLFRAFLTPMKETLSFRYQESATGLSIIIILCAQSWQSSIVWTYTFQTPSTI